MADLTIRGLPEDLHEKLKRLSIASRRSVNKEILLIIELALKGIK